MQERGFTMPVYELHWKSIPLGAIEHFRKWYDPYLGCGVYMMVVATTDERYVGYYIGKSKDIGRRWREHLHSWFLDPPEGYWIANSAEDFLRYPERVISCEEFKKELHNRREIQREILDQSWFTFAELNGLDLAPELRLEHIEYVLQEGLREKLQEKLEEGLELSKGFIGDSNKMQPPPVALTIRNRFSRDFLRQTLPCEMVFQPD